MRLTVERLGKASFTVQSRGHLLLSDQPKDHGGSDTAMTPPELFLASLGTCIGYYVAQYCDSRNLDSSEIRIEVTGEIVPNPGRVGKIDVKIQLPWELEPERSKALLRAATHCTIHNTLLQAPEIHVDLETPAVCAG